MDRGAAIWAAVAAAFICSALGAADAGQPPVRVNVDGLGSGLASEIEYHYGKCYEVEDVDHCKKALGLIEEHCADTAALVCAAGADMYERGAGVPPNPARAGELAAQACTAGDQKSCAFKPATREGCYIGRPCDGECIPADDRCWSEPMPEPEPEPVVVPSGPPVLPEGTVAEIEYHLGKCNDWQDVDNCLKALLLLEVACEDGFAPQCLGAASLYDRGIGTVADAKTAKKLAKRGCELGDEKACTFESSGVEGCGVGTLCDGECRTGSSCGDETPPEAAASIERTKKDTARQAKKSKRRSGSSGGGKRCVKGKPCGNSCIASWKKCHK